MSQNKNSHKYFLQEKAGRFVWPSLAGEELTKEEERLLKIFQPSGLVLFSRSLKTIEQSIRLISHIKSLYPKEKPPIIAIDQEGGRVSRLPVPRGKSALYFAERDDFSGLEKQILSEVQIGKQLGISCFLAPVADILSREDNEAVGDRCFGRDAQIVSKFSSFVFQILKKQNILSCAKHFPGHGNVKADSHKALPISFLDLETYRTREWLPFKQLIDQDIPLVMSAHVLSSAIDPFLPATLSKITLQNFLRGELGFQGLILSDDLRMNAISEFYKVKKRQEASIIEDLSYEEASHDYLISASLDALLAGCDILLCCQSIAAEYPILESLYHFLNENPDLFQEKEERIERILSLFRL